MQNSDEAIIALPKAWKFKSHDVYDFENVVQFFDWSYRDQDVLIDFSQCSEANYQALSLFVLYAWFLRANGCYIDFKYASQDRGASLMWKMMGGKGVFPVFSNQDDNFRGNEFKPLFAIRNSIDFNNALNRAESYTKDFDIEYEKTLRYVIAELLYNTLEHGKNLKGIPSLLQFTWYQNKSEISFIIADLGVGIKKHIRQAYPEIGDDVSAIMHSLKPNVSGTFNRTRPYAARDNAGVGLFISSNIIRKLNADMHIISGHGVVHISPSDVTSKSMNAYYPGTFVNVTIKLNSERDINLQRMMSEFRSSARDEINKGDEAEKDKRLYVHIRNFFGRYAEDKSSAIRFRDERILPAVLEEKSLLFDFDDVVSSPHSFLSALLAVPIQNYGIYAYKKIKIINANPEIRETLDYIMDENTGQ